MRKIIFSLIVCFLATISLHAQTPQVINYQAVVRNNAGDVIKNQNVRFRLSITEGANGAAVYTETHQATTSVLGLVNLSIGAGTVGQGSLSNLTLINWASGQKFLKIEVDVTGGSNYVVMGSQQFVSVPYALYAANAGNASNVSNLWQQNSVGINYNNGKVGIGTNNPVNKLHIEGSEDGLSGEDGRLFLKLKNTSTSSASNVAQIFQAGNSGTFTIVNHHSSTYTVVPNADDMGQVWSTGKGLILRASPAAANQDLKGSIRFYTGWNPNSTFASNERMRISEIGNVGIGTDAPKAKLEVNSGDVYLTDSTKGIILKSPNGNCWRVTVDNTGNLIRTQITCPQ